MRNLCWSKPQEQERGKGVKVYFHYHCILLLVIRREKGHAHNNTTSNDAIGNSSFMLLLWVSFGLTPEGS